MKRLVLFMAFVVLSFLSCKKDLEPVPPQVYTVSVSNITSSSASFYGEANGIGAFPDVDEKGFCLSKNKLFSDVIGNIEVSSVGNTYACDIEDLRSNYTYYVRAYAKNRVGTSYGEIIKFRTLNDTVTNTSNIVDQNQNSNTDSSKVILHKGDNKIWGADGEAANALGSFDSQLGYIHLSCIGKVKNDWDVQFYCIFKNMEGQVEGNEFKLTFDIAMKFNGKISIWTGKDKDYQFSSDDNTELIFENGFESSQDKKYEIKQNIWTTIEYGGIIGSLGANRIGIQINLGDGNYFGDVFFRNINVQFGNHKYIYFTKSEEFE